VPKGADAATEIVASADLHAEAVAEDEWSGPVEDLFEALPEPTAEEREAIQRSVDEVEQYRKALSSRDRAELADLLREEDLPSWVRHSIADIIDPRRRWHPPWARYDALSVAILAKNAKEARAAAKLDCPKKLKAAALAEARAVRFAYAYERKRTRDGLSHEEAID
jgi:hypothetical protein